MLENLIFNLIYINEATLGNALHNPRLSLFEYPRAGIE